MAMTVDETISMWTEEERERLAPLIEECRERERRNKDTEMEHARLLMRMSDEMTGQLAEAILTAVAPGQKGRA